MVKLDEDACLTGAEYFMLASLLDQWDQVNGGGGVKSHLMEHRVKGQSRSDLRTYAKNLDTARKAALLLWQ